MLLYQTMADVHLFEPTETCDAYELLVTLFKGGGTYSSN